MHVSTPLEALELADRRDARTYSRSMLLTGGPASEEANSLVTTLVKDVIAPFRASNGQLRSTMLPRYREALEPFLTDLLAAAGHGRWSRLETNNKALLRHPGGATAFKTMRAAMRTAGLLEELPGFIKRFKNWGTPQVEHVRTSFRPTERLLRLAADHGVRLDDFPVHFSASKAKTPVSTEVLEARAEKVSKDRPRSLSVDPEDPKVSTILADMKRLNAYLMAEGRIGGIVFAGLRRIFSNADRPGFDWQWHGRFYSMPNADGYENMEGGEEARVKAIQIDGEEVVEVDISASHLTILHGLLELPFDPSEDPYALPGITREEVKTWLTLALGASDPAIGGNKFNKVRKAALERYPFLADLPTLGISSLDLLFHEAEIVRLAMEDLMARGVGFLPVHDSLVVPMSQREVAANVLRNATRTYFVQVLGQSSAPDPRVL